MQTARRKCDPRAIAAPLAYVSNKTGRVCSSHSHLACRATGIGAGCCTDEPGWVLRTVTEQDESSRWRRAYEGAQGGEWLLMLSWCRMHRSMPGATHGAPAAWSLLVSKVSPFPLIVTRVPVFSADAAAAIDFCDRSGA